MNDNQKPTRNNDESRASTEHAQDHQSHASKEQLSAGTGGGKSSIETSAIHKKLKKNNRPRPLL